MDLGLKGKTVLITGGSKGIGLACAMSFAAEGCDLHLAARNRELLETVRRKIRAANNGVDVSLHAVDLRDGTALHDLATACGDSEILVNNAGDIPGGTIESLDESKWRHAWELKVFGYINLTRELFRRMKARKRGVIVNIIGMAGENPTFEYLCGGAANAGLAAFTKGMGKGSREHGVRVLGVHPPSTRTDRILTLMKAQAKAKFGDESRYEELMGSVIEPQQVGDTVAFLASARAGQLSGIVLNLGPWDPRRLRRRRRQYAAHPAARRVAAHRLQHPRQGRVPEPGRLGEGPRRALHHPRRREARRAQARRRDRRTHRRQHRHRPRAAGQRST